MSRYFINSKVRVWLTFEGKNEKMEMMLIPLVKIKFQFKNPRHLIYFWLGIFVFFILSAMAIFYWHYYTTDELARLTPDDAAFYLQIKKPLLLSQVMQLDSPELAAAYQQLDNFFGGDFNFQKDILPFVNKQAALVVNSDNQKILIFKTAEKEIVQERFKNHNHFWLKKNVIAIADDGIDLAAVFSRAAEKNLAAKLGDNFKPFGLIKIYLDLTQLPAIISELSNDKFSFFSQNQLYKKFVQFKKAEVIINRKDNYWQFRMMPGFISVSDYIPPLAVGVNTNSQRRSSSQGGLVKLMPKDYLFFASGLLADELLSFNFFNNDVSFDFLKDEILPLVNDNFDLLIFSDHSSRKLNYALAATRITRDAPPMAIGVGAADSADDLFRERFKKFVVLNWPQRVVKTLPDKSQVVEMVTNFNDYQFKALGDDIYYFEDKGWEIGYQLKEDKVIVSNSKDYLSGDIKESVAIEAKLKDCWLERPGRFWLWRLDLKLGFKEIFLKLDQNLTFSGCLSATNYE